MNVNSTICALCSSPTYPVRKVLAHMAHIKSATWVHQVCQDCIAARINSCIPQFLLGNVPKRGKNSNCTLMLCTAWRWKLTSYDSASVTNCSRCARCAYILHNNGSALCTWVAWLHERQIHSSLLIADFCYSRT